MDKLLRPREAAEVLNCSGSMIYKYIDAGLLVAVKIPSVDPKGKMNRKHLSRVKVKDLQLFIDSHHSGS